MAITIVALDSDSSEPDATAYRMPNPGVGNVTASEGDWIYIACGSGSGNNRGLAITAHSGDSVTYGYQSCTNGSAELNYGLMYVGAGGFNSAFTATATGTAHDRCTWHILKISGADTTNCVVQSASTDMGATSVYNEPVLSSFADATNNVTLMSGDWFINNGTISADTQPSGYTAFTEIDLGYNRLQSQWLTGEDTHPRLTYSGAARQNAGWAFEIKMASAGGGAVGPGYYYQHYRKLIAG